MRVLFDHPHPFQLAHGGLQIQIEQTYKALSQIGVEVDHLRWWDDRQVPDIIHYFGRPSPAYVDLSYKKGIRLVMSELLTGLGSRSPRKLWLQKILIAMARNTLPEMVTAKFGWNAFQKANASIALTPWEGHLMSYVFGAPKEKIHIIPNGVEEVFRKSDASSRGQWLVCTAVITERKRVLELAHAAVLAKTPLWVIGKPYSEKDAYAQHFTALARQNPQTIRYEGAIDDRNQLARVYREARGFVLLSTKESLSLSALEAAACECPLLLSNLPWARTTFRENAMYSPIVSPTRTAAQLRAFYDAAPSLKPPPKPANWVTIAKQLKNVYECVHKNITHP